MPNNCLARFAINVDSVSSARDFYQKVFDWKFEPWGPPNFYLIKTGDAPVGGVGGLLQERRELVPGGRMIPTVCTVAYFQDTEGNVAAVSELEKA